MARCPSGCFRPGAARRTDPPRRRPGFGRAHRRPAGRSLQRPVRAAEDQGLALGRVGQPEEQPQRGRLARAVGTEEATHRARAERECERVDRPHFSVVLGQSARLNRRRAAASLRLVPTAIIVLSSMLGMVEGTAGPVIVRPGYRTYPIRGTSGAVGGARFARGASTSSRIAGRGGAGPGRRGDRRRRAPTGRTSRFSASDSSWPSAPARRMPTGAPSRNACASHASRTTSSRTR
jgi:hypothetical protein